ncbi:MAG: isoaspartyl peptidase/L-asparaginase [Planctomycetota bacterium]|nr:isoaspartyl peptidase/L-asparaginase [Planctomycetota bacterium]
MGTPLLLATWSFSLPAVQRVLELRTGLEDPLDACEAICSEAERTEDVDSVGYGGLPDASGVVTLDAMVMRSPRENGAVCCVQDHLEVTRLARLVMDRTPSMMIAGAAADRLAATHGLEERVLLAPSAREAWFEWSRSGRKRAHRPEPGLRPHDRGRDAPGALFAPGAGEASGPDSEDRWRYHDTIGVLARTSDGQLAGACSTSGMPFKPPGRVGDSPMIGQGLYVDPEWGMAVCTGEGELIMGSCAAHAAIERLRGGLTPDHAAREVLERIDHAFELEKHHQVGIIVCAPDGAHSAASLREGFRWVVGDDRGARVMEPEFVLHPGT